MAIKEGLRTVLNDIRETSIQNDTLYHRQVAEVLPDSDIGSFAAPILSNPDIMNEFVKVLAQKIVYTQVYTKLFRNPLEILEGDDMPIGAIGEEVYVNPAKGRPFNIDDFAGLLAKYEADVKVQYHHLNSDIQYPVTITKAKLKTAFTSWANLESFIGAMTQSLYNGCYIDRYKFTKDLISSAYASRNVRVSVTTAPNSEANAKAFITKARQYYLDMLVPSSKFNAWEQVGGYGKAIISWTLPEDMIFILRNDLASYIDVNVLASAFNIDKTSLLGRIIYVDSFDEYDSEGTKIFDGSKILGAMGDKRWFRIKRQELEMDEFYNANNRTWQMYLNDVSMYSYSLFANMIVFATEEATVNATAITADKDTVTVKAGEKATVTAITTPFNANQEITVASSATGKATATISGKTVEITGVSAGNATITLTCGNLTKTIAVTVEAVGE